MNEAPILVVGNGRSAIIAAKEIVEQGARSILVTSSSNCRTCDIMVPLGMEILGGGDVLSISGHAGKFIASISTPDDDLNEACGAVVLAIDSVGIMQITVIPIEKWSRPEGYNDMAVVASKGDRSAGLAAIRTAIGQKMTDPKANVVVFSKEVLASGLDELDYLDAQSRGVIFVRTDHPRVTMTNDSITVDAIDMCTGSEISIRPRMLVQESGPRDDIAKIARTFKLPLDISGRIRLPPPSWGPTASLREGMFICGTAIRSMLPSEAEIIAKAAATEAVTSILGDAPRDGHIASVDEDRCASCLTCVRSCPYGAASIGPEGRSMIDQEVCHGCGICVSACPCQAISLTDGPSSTISARGKKG